MITTAILNIFYNLIFSVISILPEATLPTNITNAISSANSYMVSFDFIFPVSTFAIIFGLILGIEGAILIYKIVMWFIKKIPTIS